MSVNISNKYIMSQSDYIQHKKVSTELKELAKYPSVLDANDYTLFKQYTIENTVMSNKLQTNQLYLPGTINLFNIEYNVSSCPTSFITCKSTNTRVNRKKMMDIQSTPVPRPLFLKWTDQFSRTSNPKKPFGMNCVNKKCLSINKGKNVLYCNCVNT